VNLAVKPGRNLAIMMPSMRLVTIQNSSQKKDTIRLNITNHLNKRNEYEEIFVNSSIKVPIGSMWTLSNVSSEPVVLTLKISKSY
jgi:hypothetical protein